MKSIFLFLIILLACVTGYFLILPKVLSKKDNYFVLQTQILNTNSSRKYKIQFSLNVKSLFEDDGYYFQIVRKADGKTLDQASSKNCLKIPFCAKKIVKLSKNTIIEPGKQKKSNFNTNHLLISGKKSPLFASVFIYEKKCYLRKCDSEDILNQSVIFNPKLDHAGEKTQVFIEFILSKEISATGEFTDINFLKKVSVGSF